METKTELRQIADRIGLGEYPPELESIYETQKGCVTPACDVDLIDRLQTQYDLFGEFYDLVKTSAEDINADPDLNTWVNVASRFHSNNETSVSCKLPTPEMADTVATNFMMLHILLPMIPDAFAEMKARGLSEEALQDARDAYKLSIQSVQNRTGIPGVDKTYFWWLNLYCRAMIFKLAGFWFEIHKFPKDAMWLCNRETKQSIPLVVGKFHRDCRMHYGAKNFKDPEGAFEAEISEDNENFYGHACIDNVVSRQEAVYSKKFWECAGNSDAYCLGIHIPRGADISNESTMRACRAALQLVHERFPEYNVGNAVFCRSWLLNPRLKDIQGPHSRITQFEESFIKYPNRDDGDGIFGFVFMKKPEDYADLPEDTSLQRKLKKMYMEGDCIHIYSGAIFMEK